MPEIHEIDEEMADEELEGLTLKELDALQQAIDQELDEQLESEEAEEEQGLSKGYDPSTYFRSLEGFKRNHQDRIMEITVDHTKSAVITAQLAQEQCKV